MPNAIIPPLGSDRAGVAGGGLVPVGVEGGGDAADEGAAGFRDLDGGPFDAHQAILRQGTQGFRVIQQGVGVDAELAGDAGEVYGARAEDLFDDLAAQAVILG